MVFSSTVIRGPSLPCAGFPAGLACVWPAVAGASAGSTAVAPASGSTTQSHSVFSKLLFWCEVAVVKPFQTPSLDLDAQFPFNMADHGRIFGSGKGESLSGLFGAASATNAVSVSIRGIWEVEIYHVGDFRNINAVGRNVSGHQDVEFAGAEAVHGLLPGILGHVSLERAHPEPILAQFQSQCARPVLGASEYQGSSGGCLF